MSRNPIFGTSRSAICTTLVFAAVMFFTGCSKTETTASSRTTSSQSGVESVLQQKIAEADNTNDAVSQNGSVTTAPVTPASVPVQDAVQNVASLNDVPVTVSVIPETIAPTITAKNAFGETISAPIAAPQSQERVKPVRPSSESVSVDVDLTALSSTMVYSEVLNIMQAPETYIGKTVKMNGIFSYYHDEKTNKYYFGCIIQDATACCAQGIEFILTNDYIYPEDYPQEGEIVTVAGEFMTYEEDGFTYFTLKNSTLLV